MKRFKNDLKKYIGKRESQNLQVAKHLKRYKTITPFKLHDYGIMRLSARIFQLKKIGIPIKSELINAGDGVKYCRYTLMSSK